MKLQPMTWGRGVELFFGAVIPSLLIAPSLIGFIAFYGFLLSKIIVKPTVWLKWESLVLLGWFLLFAIPLGSLISLLMVVLFGSYEIAHHKKLHFFVVTIGIAGLLIGFFFLTVGLIAWVEFVQREFDKISLTWALNPQTWRSFLSASLLPLSLVGPLWLGVCYLPSLLKRIK